MNILLTFDLLQPPSPEKEALRFHLKAFYDQWSFFLKEASPTHYGKIDLLLGEDPPKISLEPKPTEEEIVQHFRTWAQETSSPETANYYAEQAPRELQEYDLIIGMNLGAGALQYFSFLGIPTLSLKRTPMRGLHRFVLARANFEIPEELHAPLPDLRPYYLLHYPFKDVPREERQWWLTNRFLLNPKRKYPNTLFIGTPQFQPEKIFEGKWTSLLDFEAEINEILQKSPHFYYVYQHPVDHLEPRLLKRYMVNIPSFDPLHLIVRPEFDQLVSLDSSFVPLAKRMEKPIRILGPQSAINWVPFHWDQFFREDFLNNLSAQKISS